jgi:anthranilate synthase component 1
VQALLDEVRPSVAAADAELQALRWQIEAEDGERFCAGVERIKQLIAAGDVFQVNLSRGWRAVADRPIASSRLAGLLYASLCQRNPAPFAGLANMFGGSLVSASPERLVEVHGRQVSTRPIAGTRPRGADAIQDQQLLRELLENPKERAEHIMLIDLERNDLGRVCEAGSMQVDELMVSESYASVHHIVSNVSGRLRAGLTPVDAIAATFPGGTITGCPKVRCMQIIAELEQQPRHFYTGSMGYLSRHGSMDLNILIRSLWCQDETIRWRCGSGIVADSVATSELAETEAKAEGIVRSLNHLRA